MAKQKIYTKYNIDKYSLKTKDDLLNDDDQTKIIFNLIQEIIKSNDDVFLKILSITELMTDINSKDLLINTLKIFDDLDFYNLLKNCLYRIEKINFNYSKKQTVRIQSIICAYYIRFERFKDIVKEEFYYEITDNKIRFPNVNFGNYLIKNSIITINKNILKTKNDYNELIVPLSGISYKNKGNKLEEHIKFLERQRDSISIEKVAFKLKGIDVESRYWFIIGVKLATGELQKIYKMQNQNARQTAIALGNENYRPFISESIADTNINDKNIFKRKKADLQLIIEYCKRNNMAISDKFQSITDIAE